MKKRLKRDKSLGFLAVALASLIILFSALFYLEVLSIAAALGFALLMIGPIIGYFIAKKNGDIKGMKGAKLLLVLATIFNFIGIAWISYHLVLRP
jgi:uncharacterized membrane protein YGL010W